MDAAVEAWNTMGWFEGFLFTAWLVALYVGKLKIDQRFARRTVYRVKLEDEKSLTVMKNNGPFGIVSKTGSSVCLKVKQKQSLIRLITIHHLM